MEDHLSLGRAFFKAHGHGNDYLVFEEGADWPVTPRTVRGVCHRQRGAGGDGIVALLTPGEGRETRSAAGDRPRDRPFRLRMFNPDGSEFERSGNGLRILGAYLFRKGWVAMGVPFPVEVGGDRVEMEILGRDPHGGLDILVDMGRAAFGMEAVGGTTAGLGPGGTFTDSTGEILSVQPVSVGNPHCVVFRDALAEGDLLSLGPFLTTHPAFPEGVNVQLARAVDPRTVEILIWERGVGRTASSGTSACAVASAFVHRGLLSPGRIRVLMEGGSFLVEVTAAGKVRLEGPVQAVADGVLAEDLLEALVRSGPGRGRSSR